MMLVLVLFGSHRSMHDWFDVDAHWNPTCVVTHAHSVRAVLPNATEFRGVVVAPGWREAVARLHPMAVIEHESIRRDLGERAAAEVHHHATAYMRR